MKEIPNNAKGQDLKSFTLELDAAEKREILSKKLISSNMTKDTKQ